MGEEKNLGASLPSLTNWAGSTPGASGVLAQGGDRRIQGAAEVERF